MYLDNDIYKKNLYLLQIYGTKHYYNLEKLRINNISTNKRAHTTDRIG